MQPIPTEFEGTRDQRGFKFKLLKRQGMTSLWSKQKHGQTFYEVVVLQHREQKVWPDGRVTEAKEAFPSPEEWGVLGWSPYDLDAAERRFKALCV